MALVPMKSRDTLSVLLILDILFLLHLTLPNHKAFYSFGLGMLPFLDCSPNFSWLLWFLIFIPYMHIPQHSAFSHSSPSTHSAWVILCTLMVSIPILGYWPPHFHLQPCSLMGVFNFLIDTFDYKFHRYWNSIWKEASKREQGRDQPLSRSVPIIVFN